MSNLFCDFLHENKKLTQNGINSRIARLNWVERICQMSAAEIVKSIENMHNCRKIIYMNENDGHKAGNYYNSLMLYFEFFNGRPCPRINSK